MRVIYENSRGTQADFSRGVIRAVKIGGTSAYAVINSSESAFFYGADSVSSSLGARRITVTLAVCSKDTECISALNSIAETEEKGRLIFITEDSTKETACYLEKMTVDQDSDPVKITMTFVCPSPFFESASSHMESGALLCGTRGMLEFDWELKEDGMILSDFTDEDSASVVNNGTFSSGCIITVHVLRQTESIRIGNADTGEYIELDGVWNSGSTIKIDTRHGSKGVECTENGVDYTDVISRLKWGSAFFSLIPGVNRIYVRTSGGAECLSAYISFRERYEGI
ncbi:MAG: phage tail family protein [Oscillospiraceae bacterium]|nr:phage tail family protein [Oscillospiraceae bacterium]